ncbi:TatD DNase family protein [Crenobacter luteus]|uniref:DNAase n=1 Tax=Crenobacter luteus TaxID=1452487 RepID=A0A165FHR7_9NEIS|nr:TatD family hydrolase [Crenobacter luteus]KZE33314.1 DNAase [Crenobacter luteus]TCP13594.1 TatD DNase family protein [Crenobacter luteus]
MFLPASPDCGLIDSHCHLDAPELDAIRDAAVDEARAAGVGQIVVPAVAVANFASTLAMRARYGCLVALGLHPIYVDRHLDDHLGQLEAAIVAHRPVAVGEIGLDFYLPGLDAARQEALFVEQLRLARRHGLPVIVHLRRSQDRVLKYLRQERVESGIAHAFNGSAQQADAFLRQGLRLGFGGAMSYAGSRRIRALAATLPASAIVLETDSPDIRPQWAQAWPNRPANVAAFAALLATLRGVPVETVARDTTANTLSALGLSH